ncbi:Arylacetamide deacetylase [Olea europaea subsp. europaea]|uniref:Arylacetamide deacetylase n=1 Tax=Olea europaea subsp. europaea TaxID=158383 RepID=A0A8S0SFE0_OLEEU|nr:Arylacetamide deacetylase [Olea europaea subsp. europaea]
MAANSTEILHDFPPIIRIYKDGRVERLSGEDIVPASVDSETGVQSKDIQISPEFDISARLYLPGTANPGRKLPLLVYFHGGGFVVDSPFSPLHHNHMNSLVAEANVVAVSVGYRLAPEHPLPIAYEDSWLALKWVASQSTGDKHEPWIQEYADFDHVYLGGDSAGANIAHNMAIRFGLKKLDGINLDGIFLTCPFFWGKDPIGNEDSGLVVPKSFVDNLWIFSCPNTTGLDDPLINPSMDLNLSKLGCKKVLIYVAEKDLLKDRGYYYKEALMNCGWGGDVDVVEVKGEGHVFSVFSPNSENAKAMFKRVALFMNNK